MIIFGLEIHRASRFHRTSARRVFVVTFGAVALVGAGIAFAAWTSTGTGTGAAKARSFTGVVVSAGTATGQLYPGGSNVGDLVVTATNNNPFPVTVTLAQDAGAKVVSNPVVGGCAETTNGSAAITGVSFAGGSFSVPANSSVAVTRTITASVSMSSASVSACQGATFDIPVTTTAVSS